MKLRSLLLAIAITSVLSSYGEMGLGNTADGGSQIMSRSSVSEQPIISLTQGIGLEIFFFSNNDIIEVNIKDNKSQTVYNKLIDTNIDNQIRINTTNYPAGAYTIEIKNKKGFIMKPKSFKINKFR